eukprot:15360246-Ditylum_brightwellii.AAC.1
MVLSAKCWDKLVPINVCLHRILYILHTFHHCEEIIIEDMGLWRNALGVKIQNQTNIGGMFSGIKNKNWASPDMKLFKMVVVIASKPKQFLNWGPAVFA